MNLRTRTFPYRIFLFLFAMLSGAIMGCNPTKHLKKDEFLLRKNVLKLQTDKGVTEKGELKDNIERLIIQKPNKYLVLGYFPYKVWLYNLRYKKYASDSANFQLKLKTVEKPVVFDSTVLEKSSENIRNYLFNQGYFYPSVSDTVIYKQNKAYATYRINTGTNFLIRKTTLDVNDSAIYTIVNASMDESLLKEGNEFSMSLLQQERSRITNVLRDNGYYKFTQENVVDFTLDTFNKALLRDVGNPFEAAINFLALQKKEKKPTLDINLVIRTENPDAYKRYVVNNVTIYPDFISREDVRDSTMKETILKNVKFRYHDYYVKEKVILKQIFLEKGLLYRQSDYDATINKLNQLGVFQTIRIFLVEDTLTKNNNEDEKLLNVFVLMSASKKFDFTFNFEVSAGTTYQLGASPTISFRNHNLGKGANLFTASVSGGLESTYNVNTGNNFFEHFSLLTKTFSVLTSIDFPKFLAPFKFSVTKRNQPRTVVSFGTSLLDRLNYFTLTNTAANVTYNWRETSTKTWELSPAFINIIRLPRISDSFQARLDTNQFLKNSYRETFIEGENIGFTFSNQIDKKGKSYTYLKFGLEEAGTLMNALDNLKIISNVTYAQYVKFDYDVRRYINRRRSQTALRLYGGVGIPYGKSSTLPYVKQYFVGGAYSIRGWRIRTLGPGGYYDPAAAHSNGFIDRTGDMKIEANAEYRFDLIQLFSGGIKLKGALFSDAGNIWLVNKSNDYPNGEFKFNKLGKDIALSAGAGIRLDLAGFFILRFDGAVPLKEPYNATYDYGGWKNPFDGHLGISDVILNIAVGYPF